MSDSAIISYNSENPKERSFVKELLNYLGTKHISAVADDPNISESRVKQQLLNAQWLVLFLTPEAIKSPQVQSLLNDAFTYVNHGHMQGILALAFSSNPVALEDMPSPLWSTIRIYYTGERDEDHQRAFEKLSRTLSYTQVPVRAVSSPANNWASSFSPAASRPLPEISQPVRNLPPRLVIPVVSALILIIFFLAFFLVISQILKPRTTSTPTTNITLTPNKTLTASVKASATAHANATVTAQANATATVLSQLSTLKPPELYTNVTRNPPTISMNTQNNNQGWDKQSPCTFTNGIYQISNGIQGQYTPCMAHKIKPKNFAYQAKMTIYSNGDSGGLIFRADDSLMTLYRLSLDSQGMYTLYLCQPCADLSASVGNVLRQRNFNINSLGVPNTITVIAINNDVYLYINTKFVEKLDGSAINSSGEIGLYAVLQHDSSKISFTDVKVWDLDPGQP